MRLRSFIPLLAVSFALALLAAGCGSSSSSSSSGSAASAQSSSSSSSTTTKHHRGRKVAAVAGGAALAHHIHKKHKIKKQASKLHAGEFCSNTHRHKAIYKAAHLKCKKGRLVKA